jgi:hypothetical protein
MLNGEEQKEIGRGMKTYTTPELRELGTMSDVTRKSGPAFDVEVMDYALADGNDPCDFYPFHWCP